MNSEVSTMEKRLGELAGMVGTRLSIATSRVSFSSQAPAISSGKMIKKVTGKITGPAAKPSAAVKSQKKKALAAPPASGKVGRPEQVIPFDDDDFKDF